MSELCSSGVNLGCNIVLLMIRQFRDAALERGDVRASVDFRYVSYTRFI
jgi:hypothetical protein